ncbi:guanitoxin biosynthesis L-enduracididine beta-hydroxylase GntD [Sphaerisporangium sp. B11E5]|uniref:guanitoxin biosynthesis L-enduracididine beta-hydroxylase GntD n=1 Tax=Sphaerisporangium sp. B11E5 TaxID=3153563 RepID=UPI00325D27AB
MIVEPFPSYRLAEDDLKQLDSLIDDLIDSGYDPAGAELYSAPWSIIRRLPPALCAALTTFRLHEQSAALVLDGLAIDDNQAGPTPLDWSSDSAASATRREELFLGMVAMMMGDTFSWSTLQAGRLIQNVIPLPGDEQEQSGHGSEVELAWHTEDAFHPYRCDYLLLLGIRNRDATPTLVSSIRDVHLSDSDRATLFEERFQILPDNEHLRQLADEASHHPGFQRIQLMRDDPPPVSVLFGARSQPYLRIDPFFMRCARDDDLEAAAALERLTSELERVQRNVVIAPGSLLILDNHLAVHGRRAFQARYDGTDRWLKKAIVTRDLRKSRDMRVAPESRVIV